MEEEASGLRLCSVNGIWTRHSRDEEGHARTRYEPSRGRRQFEWHLERSTGNQVRRSQGPRQWRPSDARWSVDSVLVVRRYVFGAV